MDASGLVRNPLLYQAAAAGQLADGVACIEPVPYIARCLDTVGFPAENRWIFPVVKFASAAGLAAAPRYPGLARLTAAMLTLYFTLAAGSHIRVRDFGLNFAATLTLFTFYGTLAATGGPTSSK